MSYVIDARLKRRSENVILAPQARLKKAGHPSSSPPPPPHNITINNKLKLHYLLQVYHVLQKKKKTVSFSVLYY